MCVRAARPSGRALCDAGAGYSAVKCQSWGLVSSQPRGTPSRPRWKGLTRQCARDWPRQRFCSAQSVSELSLPSRAIPRTPRSQGGAPSAPGCGVSGVGFVGCVLDVNSYTQKDGMEAHEGAKAQGLAPSSPSSQGGT